MTETKHTVSEKIEKSTGVKISSWIWLLGIFFLISIAYNNVSVNSADIAAEKEERKVADEILESRMNKKIGILNIHDTDITDLRIRVKALEESTPLMIKNAKQEQEILMLREYLEHLEKYH